MQAHKCPIISSIKSINYFNNRNFFRIKLKISIKKRKLKPKIKKVCICMFGKSVKDIWSSLAVYYKKDSGNYWDSITPCCISKMPEKLLRYYLDFSSKADYPETFDQNEIPLYQKGYHPVVICQYALGLYELLFKNNYSDMNLKSKYLSQAEWLLYNSVKVKGRLTWLVNKKIRGYGLEKPWSSALVQGEAISVLLRAYSLTEKAAFLDAAREALDIFELDVKEGGIKNEFSSCPVYEEYPSLKPNFVLNGFVFSLFGLFDFILFNNDPKAVKLFNEGVKTLEKLLSLFDTGYWSQYNLYYYPKTYLASFKYHLLHIEQLRALHHLTGSEIFLKYSNKWSRYGNNIYIKSFALIRKITAGNIVRE